MFGGFFLRSKNILIGKAELESLKLKWYQTLIINHNYPEEVKRPCYKEAIYFLQIFMLNIKPYLNHMTSIHTTKEQWWSLY